MLNKEHITLGEATTKRKVVVCNGLIICDLDTSFGLAIKDIEIKANAAFIAEAFNVFNETGMTPRELLEVVKSTGLNINLLK